MFQPDAASVALSAAETRAAQGVTGLVIGSGGTVPIVDTNLVVAARHLALGTVEPRDALIEAGISDAFAIPLEFGSLDSSDILGPVRSLLQAEVRGAAPTHFGIGIVGSRAALLFVRRGAVLSQFPKRMLVGQRYLLNGTLSPQFRNPLVLVATPAGDVIEYRPGRKRDVFWRTITFDYGPGRYTIEVQAENKHGVQVLNLMEVWANEATSADAGPVVRLRPRRKAPVSAAAAERRAITLINRSRLQKGLSELQVHEVLTDAARHHADDMARGGYFGHVSPRRGGLSERLDRAGLRPLLALENVAISVTPDDAHSELLRSPSHLRNVLDPDVTHIGIGAHRSGDVGGAPVYTFAQIFAAMH
ncbi:MAG: hypothetical protein ACI9OJ_004888 [Myxococcota bacterium]